MPLKCKFLKGLAGWNVKQLRYITQVDTCICTGWGSRALLEYPTSCCRHSSDKFLWLGLLIMNYESFLCVQSEFMLKTIPAGYSLLVIFQIYFFTTIKMTRKASISSISAQIVRFFSILPHTKPSSMPLAYSKQS